MKNNFYHPKFIPTWLLLFVMRLVVFMPFKLQYFCAKIIGILLKKLATKKYKIAKINIQKCFPNLSKPEQNKIINQHFTDFAMSLFEVANCFYQSPKKLQKNYQLNNLDLLQKHLKNQENIIILVGHFTTMIIAGRILADNIHFADIYRPQNNKLFNHTMVKRFEKYGIKMIKAKDGKAIIKTLKSGVPIWYAPDQDLGKNTSTVFVDFFNIPTNTITATSKLAKISKAKIVHFDFYRTKNGYVCRFKEVEDFANDDKLDALKINQTLEKQILKQPSQYLWTHKRFKTRPKDEKSFY